MRLGILGGTFDPIHLGHLRVAEEVGEELELEKVYLIPAALPPHKDIDPITPFQDRLSMVRLALNDSPILGALDLEGRRLGLSYSIETIREFKALFKTDLELFFFIGMDAFFEIETWKEYKSLFEITNFVVIKRPGVQGDLLEPFLLSLGVGIKREKDKNKFTTSLGNILIYKEATLMDISSTRIREMVRIGKSIRFLVPEPVRAYIIEKGLYVIDENS
ncbi:MAG: nicotinate-nucleotide adenylyltransferase [Thermodesulfobacteriota bacterium]|nr:nicotinate-nucleotide adenylyltransferase [Thermodesulfobacteriota bacterium]